MGPETFDTVVIGAGQAGLSAGYHLRKAGRSFAILDGNARVGDNWRERYDSLRLFTPAWATRLPGWRFPAKGITTSTKDEMADYLEAYAARFELPVTNGVRVDALRRNGDGYVVSAGDRAFRAANVIVATGANRDPRVPAMAADLDPGIVQMHSTAYRKPSQLREGAVLVVGAGNSGGDISLEVSATHPTWLSGPIRGHVPVDIDGWFARYVAFRLIRFVGLHVLSLRTPLGRKVHAKGMRGDPLVRVKPKWLDAAGVRRVGKTVAVRDGRPVVEDGTVLDVANVIWCTGFRHDLSWIDLPIFAEDGTPRHDRGVVTTEPGLYFVGLPFQFAKGSDVIPGVPRDAAYVVRHLVRRSEGANRRERAAVAA